MCVAPMPLQCAGLRQTLCATQIEQAVDGTEREPRSRSGVASMADAMLQRHRLLSEEYLVDALGEREGGVEFGQLTRRARSASARPRPPSRQKSRSWCGYSR